MDKKKCYIYTRVSTAMQVEGYSLDAQEERIRKYAEAQDFYVVHVYSDEGKSGKNTTGRPFFTDMMDDIKSGKDDIKFVLVFKLSRFGRNAADVLNNLQLMQDYGVNLICVDDGIDSSKDSGKLVISVLSAVAEIERENIIAQTMAGRRQKALEGKWNGGFAPYGYKLVKGKLEIAEDEVEVIREIFNKYVNTNMGVGGIAKYLNDAGFEKKVRQNVALPQFSADFIKKVLDNPVYCGKVAYGRRKTEKIPGKRNEYHIVKQNEYMVNQGIHDAIVSEELWSLAHMKRQETAVKWQKTFNDDHANILSGILKCPICGGSLYGSVNRKRKGDGSYYKEYYYYGCKHRLARDGHKCTYRKQWEQEMVDSAVAEVIKKLVQNPRFENAIREKIGAQVDTKELEKELAVSERTILKLHRTKDRLAQEIDDLDYDDAVYELKYADLQKRLIAKYGEIAEEERKRRDIQIRIQNIEQQKITEDKVYQFLLDFDKYYDRFTELEKKEFLNSFVEEVNLYEDRLEDGRFLKSIKFKFPVFFNGEEVREIGLDNEAHVETVVLLSRKGT